jgi:hypothetical protein
MHEIRGVVLVSKEKVIKDSDAFLLDLLVRNRVPQGCLAAE